MHVRHTSKYSEPGASASQTLLQGMASLCRGEGLVPEWLPYKFSDHFYER